MSRTKVLFRICILLSILNAFLVVQFAILFPRGSYHLNNNQMGLIIHEDSPLLQRTQLKFTPPTIDYGDTVTIDRGTNDIVVYNYVEDITVNAPGDANLLTETILDPKATCQNKITYEAINGGHNPSVTLLC